MSNLFTAAQLDAIRAIVRSELAAQRPDPAAIRAQLTRLAERTAGNHRSGSEATAPAVTLTPNSVASQAA
jgi:hypothetical protein